MGGSFNTVNGVARQKVASLDLTTRAALTTFGFTSNTNDQVTRSPRPTDGYVGGRNTRSTAC